MFLTDSTLEILWTTKFSYFWVESR